MRRLVVLAGLAAFLVVTGAACSGSEEEPGGITRIDGPAQVDDDVRVGPAGGDDSSEG